VLAEQGSQVSVRDVVAAHGEAPGDVSVDVPEALGINPIT
jgi:hypothetical protein